MKHSKKLLREINCFHDNFIMSKCHIKRKKLNAWDYVFDIDICPK